MLHAEHLGQTGTEHIGIEKSHLVALSGQCHGQVYGYGAFAHTALSAAYGNHVAHLRQHLARFGACSLCGFHANCHINFGTYVSVNGGLCGLDHGFEKRIRVALKDE